MIQKTSGSLSTKVSWNFYDLVKFHRIMKMIMIMIMITNVTILSIYESLFQHLIKTLPTIYHNKI